LLEEGCGEYQKKFEFFLWRELNSKIVVLLWNIIVLCYFEYLGIFIATKGPVRPLYYVPARPLKARLD
jgi:hypothetical protein